MSEKILEVFDPLTAKSTSNEAMAVKAIKKEITNILQCYVGWYDPFCELIQNSLDAVDKRNEKAGYTPKIHIVVNLQENSITVSDNGIGFTKEQFMSFMAPDFSFKDDDGNSRGHKGVGATYLAYGFNNILVATKTENFSAQYSMKGGRTWINSKDVQNRPQMEVDDSILVFCKPFLAKVAKHFWRMLHRHFGESCNGLVSRFSG